MNYSDIKLPIFYYAVVVGEDFLIYRSDACTADPPPC